MAAATAATAAASSAVRPLVHVPAEEDEPEDGGVHRPAGGITRPMAHGL